MEAFTVDQKVSFFGKAATPGIPGKVIEVKERTGIVVCEFTIGSKNVREAFHLNGISIRGEEYGLIAPTAIKEGCCIARLLEDARTAVQKDDRVAFLAIQRQILGATDNCTQITTVAALIHAFCRSKDEHPSTEMVEAIRSRVRK